jgi:hypothetical protein
LRSGCSIRGAAGFVAVISQPSNPLGHTTLVEA